MIDSGDGIAIPEQVCRQREQSARQLRVRPAEAGAQPVAPLAHGPRQLPFHHPTACTRRANAAQSPRTGQLLHTALPRRSAGSPTARGTSSTIGYGRRSTQACNGTLGPLLESGAVTHPRGNRQLNHAMQSSPSLKSPTPVPDATTTTAGSPRESPRGRPYALSAARSPTPSIASSCATPNVDSGLGRTTRDVSEPAWPALTLIPALRCGHSRAQYQRYSLRTARARPRPETRDLTQTGFALPADLGGGDGTRTHEPLDCQSSALPAELRPRGEPPR
jgi:hypothetical protein